MHYEQCTENARDIIERAIRLGLFEAKANRQSPEAIRLLAEARAMLDTIRPRLTTLPAGQALRLSAHYDLLHRIVRGTPADRPLLDSTILRAFDARLHGDKTVDEYDLYRAIRSRVEQRVPAFMGRPLQWLVLTLEKWHKRVKTAQPAASDYDARQQTQLLLQSDLYAFEGAKQADFKQKLRAESRNLMHKNATSANAQSPTF